MKLRRSSSYTPEDGTVKATRLSEKLGDFTTPWNVIPIAALATAIGIFAAFVALALLRLIGIFTNLFFFQRWGTALVSPANNRLGWWEVFVPMIGGLIVWPDGALRLRPDSRPRHSRGH